MDQNLFLIECGREESLMDFGTIKPNLYDFLGEGEGLAFSYRVVALLKILE